MEGVGGGGVFEGEDKIRDWGDLGRGDWLN